MNWTPELATESEFGLYVHIPFCSQLCHYCDFAKTANFDRSLIDRYFCALQEHLDRWIAALTNSTGRLPTFTSVFWGGGTPGLFGEEMTPIFDRIRPLLAPGAEISLEANPKNVTDDAVKTWTAMGFNRISIGIQSFDDRGLKFLHRDHSRDEAVEAVSLAKSTFSSVNVDLIYGWPGQRIESWSDDLDRAIDLGTDHLSLYNLIYEGGTPIGRAMRRGAIQPASDDFEYSCYEAASSRLAAQGFVHDEVSNWAKSGHSCRHNWLYWQMRPYLGIGCGAHGFLPAGNPMGMRYSYQTSERRFVQTPINLGISDAGSLKIISGADEDKRDRTGWLLEYLGCALRSRLGVDTQRILSSTGLQFFPTPRFLAAEAKGQITRHRSHVIRLAADEWFRETAWSLLLSDCFRGS